MPTTARRLIVAAVATAGFATSGFAQPAPPAATTPPPVNVQPSAPTTQPPDVVDVDRIDLQLDGVTLQGYVDYLHDVSKANFILLNDPMVEPTEIRLPPMKLRRIPLDTAVNLLKQLPGVNIAVEKTADEQVPTWSIIVRAAIAEPQPATATPLPPPPPAAMSVPGKRVFEYRPDTAAGNRPTTKLYPLERMLLGEDGAANLNRNDEAQVKALNERIEQTLQLIDVTLLTQAAGAGDGNERAQVNLHGSTRTLIVKGTREQIAAIEEAINAMTVPHPTADAKAGLHAEERMKFERERSELRGEIQALRAKLEQSEPKVQTPEYKW